MPSKPPTWTEPEKLLAEASRVTLEKIRRDMIGASPKIVAMLSFIEKRLYDPTINVARVKEACHIRDNSIAIRFHREIGTAPKRYINDRRLETAASLLQSSDLKIWQIAETIGFSSLGVFSKAFNRWTGQRPNAYRKLMRDLTDREIQRLDTFSDFFRRAVAGELSEQEARRLIAKLMAIYPGAGYQWQPVRIKNPANRRPSPAPTET